MQQEDTELLVGEMWYLVTYIWGPSLLLLPSRPRNHQPGCVQAALSSSRLAGFLTQSSTATIHRKTLLCHQPKVALKEQFPGAPDWLLTQKLAAKFPVAGGNLEAVRLRRTQLKDRRGAFPWPHWPDAEKERRAPFSLTPSDFGAPFLRAVPSGVLLYNNSHICGTWPFVKGHLVSHLTFKILS